MADQLFHTRYADPHGSLLPGFVWASSPAHAERLVIERGLGEAFIDRPLADIPERPSVLLRRAFERRIHDNVRASRGELVLRDDSGLHAIHGLAFLGHLATHLGRASAQDVLSDVGWLHNAVHYLFVEEPYAEGFDLMSVVRAIEAVERSVPGFLPRHGVDP